MTENSIIMKHKTILRPEDQVYARGLPHLDSSVFHYATITARAYRSICRGPETYVHVSDVSVHAITFDHDEFKMVCRVLNI